MNVSASATMRVIRLPAVCEILGLSRTTLYRQVGSGLFPRPVSVGVNSRAWGAHEVDAIVKARIAGKSEAEIRALVQRLQAERQQLAAS